MSRLTLYVGVRWFGSDRPGTLDIDADIDGAPVTRGGKFPTPAARKAPDSFDVELSEGRHRLRARSASQGAEFEIEFDLTRDHHFAQLCYDHYAKDHPDRRQAGFTFEIQVRDFGWR
jgi:hypothetical protein